MTSRRGAFSGVLLLVLALGLPAAGAASSQPDGTGPVPPVTVAPALADQPEGGGALPPVVVEEPVAQPPNPHPSPAGDPTTVRGPVERVPGIDGADRPGGREDGGGISGAEYAGRQD